MFGGHETATSGVVPEDHVADALLPHHFLELDEERHRGERTEDFVEGGDLGAAAELGEGTGHEGPRHFGGALEGRVVVHHHGTIGGEADVEFEGVHAERGGALKGGKGVFRRFRGGAPVRHEGRAAGSTRMFICVPAFHRSPSPLGGEGDRG